MSAAELTVHGVQHDCCPHPLLHHARQDGCQACRDREGRQVQWCGDDKTVCDTAKRKGHGLVQAQWGRQEDVGWTARLLSTHRRPCCGP